MRGVWAVFHAAEVVRCLQCGRVICAVYDGTEVMVRVKPDTPDGVRAMLSRRCDRCRATLDVVVVDTTERAR